MSNPVDFNPQDAHRHFAAACFNKAWDLIDKPVRTAVEDEEMLALALASQWHWQQREDVTPLKRSVSYWQISRVFALLKYPAAARDYGRRALDVLTDDDPPFYRAYAYEALARAEAGLGNGEKMQRYLEQARQIAQAVTDDDNKKWLLADLDTIRLS